jgi:hypothetical protein
MRAVRHVGRRGEDPERREAEGEDRAELDDVPGALRDRQLARPLRIRHSRRGALHQDAQEILGASLVEARATNEAGQEQLRRLVHGAADDRPGGADDPLGQRDDETKPAVDGRIVAEAQKQS